MSSESKLTAAATIGYPNGLTWMHQWFKTSQYLKRLQQLYIADPVNKIDLLAAVDGFMISCAHMWDAFKNDPQLASITIADVQAAMSDDPNLQLCRDYANTAKHLQRRGSTDIEAAVLEAGSAGEGNFVTIGFGPKSDPRQARIDALDLANAAYSAWQRFMREHGITEPTGDAAG